MEIRRQSIALTLFFFFHLSTRGGDVTSSSRSSMLNMNFVGERVSQGQNRSLK